MSIYHSHNILNPLSKRKYKAVACSVYCGHNILNQGFNIFFGRGFNILWGSKYYLLFDTGTRYCKVCLSIDSLRCGQHHKHVDKFYILDFNFEEALICETCNSSN